MWGNWQGWVISAVMVLVTGGVFYRLANPEPESSPQGLLQDAYEPIALPVTADLDRLIPKPTRTTDAGMLYRQALIRFKTNPNAFDDPIHASPTDLSALDLLLEAADSSRMTLFESTPQELVTYNNAQPELEALRKIGNAGNTIGLGLTNDGKLDEAKKYFLATFMLGRHLFDERLSWGELNLGLTMMSDAVRNLGRLADENHQGLGDSFRKVQDEIEKYRLKLEEKVASPLTNPVESYASQYAGDIFAIAKDPGVERVWRVAAIMHLGRYRWNVADDRRGDQVWAVRELRVLDNSLDPRNRDPVISTAIRAALDLTVEQQRMNAVAQ
ncbi:MAG TPA: hypothetical protein VK797_28330 [Tepidisphaeraceae bacterium]|jgi:hypothetical protein|nr:hypothetical protein [Tepidisphaeraceae bacterium]